MKSYVSHLGDDTFAIFLFHGVIRRQRHAVRNYTRKHLPVDDFVACMKELSSAGVAVSMDEIVAARHTGKRLPKRAYAITFDDGFENNASVAAPVLDEMRIPATFYVTTGFVGTKTRSWTDEIEAAVDGAGVVAVAGVKGLVDGSYATTQQKIALLDAARTYVKSNEAVDPYAFAAGLIERARIAPGPFDGELDAKLEWKQVAALAAHPLFTIGGHSHTHRIMSFLPGDELEHEIDTSLELLKDAVQAPLRHYSYPEGLAHCYSPKVIDSLQQRGIQCSPTAEDGVNPPGQSLFHLKRVFVI
jgi:peptidoglycan/xylan/chitin deacetylase (PgdA/CDA1 family)